MDALPIDDRTDEERDADRERDQEANRDHVDEVAWRERLGRVSRSR
ncbi:hypothetical protein ACIBQX_18655 [Nonomuraea sp. NPDC049714]